MLNYSKELFFYEPYPIGKIEQVIPDRYDELVDTFPDKENFRTTEGNKYYLNEDHPEYHKVIKQNPAWREFYRFVKSREFIDSTLAFLRNKEIDL